jgi:hypothetical protein
MVSKSNFVKDSTVYSFNRIIICDAVVLIWREMKKFAFNSTCKFFANWFYLLGRYSCLTGGQKQV